MSWTLARGFLFLLLAVPAMHALALVFVAPDDPFAFLASVLPPMVLLWVLSRPIFIYYRLQGLTRPRHGCRMGHHTANLFVVLLAAIWTSSGVIVLGAFTVNAIAPSPAMGFKHWAFILACVTVHGLCARGIFELFHWRLRAGKIDLMR